MDTVLDISSRKTGSPCKVHFHASRVQFAHVNRVSCASSKHLQTRRFLDTLQGYLYDIQRILIQLHRAANARPDPFIDHLGILRDTKTGRPIHGAAYYEDSENLDDEISMRECLVSKHPTIVLFGFVTRWLLYLKHGISSVLPKQLRLYSSYFFDILSSPAYPGTRGACLGGPNPVSGHIFGFTLSPLLSSSFGSF